MPLTTLSFQVFFFSENENLSKNLNSLYIFFIYVVRTCQDYFGKCRFLLTGFTGWAEIDSSFL